MIIRGFSHSEAWVKAIFETLARGAVTSPRGMKTRELSWVQLEVWDPRTFPIEVKGREMRNVIGILEGCGLVGEFSVPELMSSRVKKFADFEDNGILWGAYGARTHGALGDAVELLKRDPDSRQAVVTFFDSKRDLNRDKRDIPCTISAQFLLRDSQLDLGISMRSNDLWLGTPYDLVQFSMLQLSVAQALGVNPGRYVHRVGSLHLYDRDADKAAEVGFKSALGMGFPLWGESDIGAISSRARLLALDRLSPSTQFESAARDLVHVHDTGCSCGRMP